MSRHTTNTPPVREWFGDARMATALVEARRRTQSKARSGAPPGALASSRWHRQMPRPRNGAT
jgi:hypothetical protein